MAALMNKFIIRCLFIIVAISFSQSSVAANQKIKKENIIKDLQTFIKSYNSQIIVDRQRVHKIAEQYLHDDEINEADFNWVKKTAEYYQLIPKQRNDQAFFNALLKRVDIIPASLIVALAVADGAWQDQHRLCLIPCSQAKSIEQQIPLFFISINTQTTYHHFREQRHLLRQQKQRLTGRQLADSLLLSPAYLQQRHVIKKLLTTHKWQKMDNL